MSHNFCSPSPPLTPMDSYGLFRSHTRILSLDFCSTSSPPTPMDSYGLSRSHIRILSLDLCSPSSTPTPMDSYWLSRPHARILSLNFCSTSPLMVIFRPSANDRNQTVINQTGGRYHTAHLAQNRTPSKVAILERTGFPQVSEFPTTSGHNSGTFGAALSVILRGRVKLLETSTL